MRARIQFQNLQGSGPGGLPVGRPMGPIGRALAMIAGGVILVAGLFFSVVVFSVLLAVGLIVGGWFWWKTRALRANLRQQMERMQQAAQNAAAGGASGGFPGGVSRDPGASGRARSRPAQGEVIDGDFIRETDPARARTRSTDRPRPPQG